MLAKVQRILRLSVPFLATFAVLAWRRPDQFFHPYIWVEEGKITLVDYIQHGWISLFYPVAGYLVLPSKIIFLSAISVSFKHLPNIEYWLTILFTGSVICTIAYAPTVIKYRFACAFMVLALPINPEVYAVSEYAFWWGTLFAFVVLLWNTEDDKHRLIRIFLLIFGGLSSPMIIPITAVLGIRALILRRRTDSLIALTGAAVAVVQAYVMHRTSAHSAWPVLDIGLVVAKFFGYFSYQPSGDNVLLVAVLGTLMATCICAFSVMERHWKKLDFCLLLACLGMSILVSIIRVPLNAIHPVLAGPRYFFYPFIFLAWIFLWMAHSGNTIQKVFSYLCLGGALLCFTQFGQRHADRLDWSTNVRECTRSDQYNMPIQFDGHKDLAWHVSLSGADCRRLSGDRSVRADP